MGGEKVAAERAVNISIDWIRADHYEVKITKLVIR